MSQRSPIQRPAMVDLTDDDPYHGSNEEDTDQGSDTETEEDQSDDHQQQDPQTTSEQPQASAGKSTESDGDVSVVTYFDDNMLSVVLEIFTILSSI